MVPVLWMFSGSLRPTKEIFGSLSPLSWGVIIPKTVGLENYTGLFSGPFGRAYLVSLAVCFLTVAIGLVVCVAAAYALAVLEFPGRGVVFAVVVISFMVPFEAIAIPLSQLFHDWGLSNTLIGLVLPGVGNGLAIFNLRQHFRAVPSSYREAATVDGASEPRVLATVYTPLSGPAITNSALLIFLGQWSSYLWPLISVSDPKLQVAPVALAKTFGEHYADYGANFAGAIALSVVPALLMFVLQRAFGGLALASGEK
jgi:multiple sugar transport system permease protein/putative chitobiose transport system permease protein